MVLYAFLVASAIWYFLTLRAVLPDVRISDNGIIWGFATLAVFSVLYGVTMVLTARSPHWKYVWLIVACIALIPSLVPSQAIAIGALFAVGMLIRNRVRHVVEDERDTFFFQPLRVAYGFWFTVMAIIVAISFYNTRPAVEATLQSALKREHIVAVMQTIEPILKQTSPDFTIDQTVEAYILAQIDPQVPAYLRAELVRQQLSALNTKYNTNIQPEDTMADVSYEIVLAFAERPFGTSASLSYYFARYFPLVSAIGIFFFLQFLFFFLKWFVIFIALGVLRLMDIGGIITYKERIVTVKYPTLS